MISYQALLLEIEQLVASTKNSPDEQHIREQLSAIRALCNVGLATGNYSAATSAQSFLSSRANQSTQSFQTSPLMTQTHNMIQNSSSLNGGKLKEEDANGDSIFDF